MEKLDHHSEVAQDHGVIPNFCLLPNVFLVVLLSEILAVLATILAYDRETSVWYQLALNSVFILWITLCSSTLFCLLREWLNRLSVLKVTLACVTAVALITSVSSVLAVVYFYGGSINIQASAQQTFLVKNVVAALLITLAIMRYLVLRQQVIVGVKAESEAKLQSLQARIQPHFLFNTLNTIASLITIDANKAEQTVEHLATLMRGSLRRNFDQVKLQQELDMCQNYIAIEQQRLGDKLRVEWQIPTELFDFYLPPFTLQPLVENAVYHGIQGFTEGGTILVSGKRSDNQLILTVENPVPQKSRPPGNQFAQKNIRQRLQIRYGSLAAMSTEEQDGHYRAIIQIPLINELKSSDTANQ